MLQGLRAAGDSNPRQRRTSNTAPHVLLWGDRGRHDGRSRPRRPPAAGLFRGGLAGVPGRVALRPAADFAATCATCKVPCAIVCPRGPLRRTTSCAGAQRAAHRPRCLEVGRPWSAYDRRASPGCSNHAVWSVLPFNCLCFLRRSSVNSCNSCNS